MAPLSDMFIVTSLNTCWFIMKCLCFIYNWLSRVYLQFNETFHIVPNHKNTVVVKDSVIIYECNYNDVLFFPDVDYDYAVYKYVDNERGTYKLIQLVKRLDEIIYIENEDQDLLMSTIAFINITVHLLDAGANVVTHDITTFVKNSGESYYVTGAELFTPSFMNWLFLSHLKQSPTAYKISILDHNIKTVTLTESQHIKIDKTSYEIRGDPVNPLTTFWTSMG